MVLVVGALWGQDDDFPFGPFRMYATATKPMGVVATPFLWAVNAEGREFEIKGAVFGLRPAELEGQYPRFRRDPELLGRLAEVYNDEHPQRPPVVELRLMRRRRELVDNRVVAVTEAQVAVWTRP